MFAGLEKERKKEKIDRKHTKKEMIHTDNLYCYYFAVLLFYSSMQVKQTTYIPDFRSDTATP